MHASLQATLYNAHFETKGVPWTAEDLLGRGDRKAREMQRMKDKFATMQFERMMVGAIDEAQIPEFILELEANRNGAVN